MKKSPPFFVFSIATALAAVIHSAFATDVPTGSLSVNTDLVRAGVKPQITWDVIYPEILFDKEKVTEDVTIHVSVFGVALESGRGSEIAASAALKVGGERHEIFSGKGSSVDASEVLVTMDVDAGTTLAPIFHQKNTLVSWNLYC